MTQTTATTAALTALTEAETEQRTALERSAAAPNDKRLAEAWRSARTEADRRRGFLEIAQTAERAEEQAAAATARASAESKFAKLAKLATADGLRASCADEIAEATKIYTRLLDLDARARAKVAAHEKAIAEINALAAEYGLDVGGLGATFDRHTGAAQPYALGWIQSESRDAVREQIKKKSGAYALLPVNATAWFGAQ